jgi:photosystem II reaction center protein Psb28
MNKYKINLNYLSKKKFLPIIKLTKSKNEKIRTATFIIVKPIFLKENSNNFKIKKISLIFSNIKLNTTYISIIFKKGKPFSLKIIFLFKKNMDWFSFLYFMSIYSKEFGLNFSKTK